MRTKQRAFGIWSLLAIVAMVCFTVAPAQAQATVPTASLQLVPDIAGDGQVSYTLDLEVPAGVTVGAFSYRVLFDSAVVISPQCTTGIAIACSGAVFNGFVTSGFGAGTYNIGTVTFDLVAGAPPQASPLNIEIRTLADVNGLALDGATETTFVSVNNYAGGPDPVVSSFNPPNDAVGSLTSSTLSTPRLLSLVVVGLLTLTGLAVTRRRQASAT